MTTTEKSAATPETFSFQADVDRLLHLVVHSLYSHKEIFLRELVSNASDAIDRLRFRALTEHDLMGDEKDLEIRIAPDRAAKTITIEDTGVGMTREELVKNLGTIAHSGTRAFLEKMKQQGPKPGELIGEFGVGFYSSWLVADKVEVVSRAAGAADAWRWTSDARGTFTVEPALRAARGTAVTLHVRDECAEFLDEWRLRDLVARYSDYVSHPIKLRSEKGELETVNKASALWRRPKSEITDEQYDEFYKHLTHDWEKPLARTHFAVEGTQEFTGLLFIPRTPPFDLFDRVRRRGVRLYVKRVFIMDDCEQLLPEYLRFVRGLVDSDDLPLNVSRELLQSDRLVPTIRSNIVKKTLDCLDALAAERPDDYKTFWATFGVVLKEGLHFDRENRERIAKLCRFDSSRDEGPTGLKDYVARMPAGQEAIYYVIGDTRKACAGSPHMEALRKKGFEVLYLTDAVDEWAVEAIRDFEGKKLVSAMKAGLKVDATEDEKKARDEKATALKPLCERFQEVLSARVKEVLVSDRLTDSPVCLVGPEGGLHSVMERILRAHDRDVPESKRILEVNPAHALVQSLAALHGRDPRSAQVGEWIEVLYDQALLTEGSAIEDPGVFARRLTSLLSEAAAQAVERR